MRWIIFSAGSLNIAKSRTLCVKFETLHCFVAAVYTRPEHCEADTNGPESDHKQALSKLE